MRGGDGEKPRFLNINHINHINLNLSWSCRQEWSGVWCACDSCAVCCREMSSNAQGGSLQCAPVRIFCACIFTQCVRNFHAVRTAEISSKIITEKFGRSNYFAYLRGVNHKNSYAMIFCNVNNRVFPRLSTAALLKKVYICLT